MNKIPCLKDDKNTFLLLKDYQDFSGWIILVINKSEIFTKADKRIKGDKNNAISKFKELYSYGKVYSEINIKSLINI